jgi:hypothetical protein
MSVWSEKKKEETKNIHIYTHIYTPSLTRAVRRILNEGKCPTLGAENLVVLSCFVFAWIFGGLKN